MQLQWMIIDNVVLIFTPNDILKLNADILNTDVYNPDMWYDPKFIERAEKIKEQYEIYLRGNNLS